MLICAINYIFPPPVLCLFDTNCFIFPLNSFYLNSSNFIATLVVFNSSPFYSPHLPSRAASIYLFVFASFVWCHFTTADLQLPQSMQMHGIRKGWLCFRLCRRHSLCVCPISTVSSGTFVNRAPIFPHWAQKYFKSVLVLTWSVGLTSILQCVLLVVLSV